jgi:hypothetical protein
MAEIFPRITYDDDGVLELAQSSKSMSQHTEQSLEAIENYPDFLITEKGDDVSVKLSIRERLSRMTDADRYGNPDFGRIIDQINPFIYFDHDETRDGVFSLDILTRNGVVGIVYPHLQRWMNTDLFTSKVGRSINDALIEPFGARQKTLLDKEYRYKRYSDGVSAGVDPMSVSVSLRDDEFGVSLSGSNGRTEEHRIRWRWPNITTIGNCACWGVTGEDREWLYIEQGSTRLYKMSTHNVDGPIQSLSLVLGMARMAFYASKYDGSEDILESPCLEVSE